MNHTLPKGKTIVAVFAHPDDEAFGPGGTLAKLALSNDVYVITVTGGEAGLCSIENHSKSLYSIRHRELLASAKILGVKKVFCLGFEDGTLSNNLYHDVSGKIEKILSDITPDILITFDTNGISGHIDHIAVSMITTFLHKRKNFAREIWYYCISKELQKSQASDYFIYFPEGFEEKDVEIVVSIDAVWNTRVKALRAHASQRHDGDTILQTLEKLPKKEFFLLCKD